MKKSAQDLQPADVVAIEGARYVFLRQNNDDSLLLGKLEGVGPVPHQVVVRYLDEVDVQEPALTQAQQHADELRETLWIAANFMRGHAGMERVERDARRLLERIEPPQPPTLDEVLHALDCIDPDHMPPSCKRVLNQARAAGVLK